MSKYSRKMNVISVTCWQTTSLFVTVFLHCDYLAIYKYHTIPEIDIISVTYCQTYRIRHNQKLNNQVLYNAILIWYIYLIWSLRCNTKNGNDFKKSNTSHPFSLKINSTRYASKIKIVKPFFHNFLSYAIYFWYYFTYLIITIITCEQVLPTLIVKIIDAVMQ